MAKTYLFEVRNAMFGHEPAPLYCVNLPHNGDVFSQPERIDHILRDFEDKLSRDHNGGAFAFVRGTPSVPVAIALASHLARRFRVTAIFSKECEGYVVAASEHPSHHVGDIIPEIDVSD